MCSVQKKHRILEDRSSEVVSLLLGCERFHVDVASPNPYDDIALFLPMFRKCPFETGGACAGTSTL
ncbi:hypothetical protein L484_008479 [Morus notabilis]|uniref:Uncharacterized protein n=1 Tax=Morus notabilis TaxID=981085 RepID=W9SF12_9ROSA|nr:hypothetical protein L484_008479 [Morus notabilis]